MKESYNRLEKRKSPRKKERLKIEYALQDDVERKGLKKIEHAYTYSIDIGSGGLGIYVNEDIDFKEGNELYIIINLPDKRKIFVSAQVVYIMPVKQKEYRYRVGLRYVDIKDEDKKAIMDFITK